MCSKSFANRVLQTFDDTIFNEGTSNVSLTLNRFYNAAKEKDHLEQALDIMRQYSMNRNERLYNEIDEDGICH